MDLGIYYKEKLSSVGLAGSSWGNEAKERGSFLNLPKFTLIQPKNQGSSNKMKNKIYAPLGKGPADEKQRICLTVMEGGNDMGEAALKWPSLSSESFWDTLNPLQTKGCAPARGPEGQRR